MTDINLHGIVILFSSGFFWKCLRRSDLLLGSTLEVLLFLRNVKENMKLSYAALAIVFTKA